MKTFTIDRLLVLSKTFVAPTNSCFHRIDLWSDRIISVFLTGENIFVNSLDLMMSWEARLTTAAAYTCVWISSSGGSCSRCRWPGSSSRGGSLDGRRWRDWLCRSPRWRLDLELSEALPGFWSPSPWQRSRQVARDYAVIGIEERAANVAFYRQAMLWLHLSQQSIILLDWDLRNVAKEEITNINYIYQ